MTHDSTRRTGLYALALWCVAVAALWPRAAHALTMYEYVRALDYASGATFVGLAVLGGSMPTLLALCTDQFHLQGVLARTLKDIGIGVIAGVVFFLGVVAADSLGYRVPQGVQLAGVVAAGWLRRDFFHLVGDGLGQLWGAAVDRVTGRIRGAEKPEGTP